MSPLLHEFVPKAVNVAVLVDPANATSAEATLRVQEAARVMGLQIHVLNATTIDEIDAALATLARDHPEAVINAPPDGYTLLLVNAADAINATLYDKLSFNFIRDIAPVGSITRESLVMALHPSVPAQTVSELIAYAKSNPGKLSMGSGGNRSTSHVAGELFKMMTATNGPRALS
jgi:hypothetical protein